MSTKSRIKPKKPSCFLTAIFCSLLIFFLFILAQIFIPQLGELLQGKIFLAPFLIFFLLALFLLFLILKEKIIGKQKKYLILNVIAAMGLPIGVLLHNLFYALAILSSKIALLKQLMELLHAGFFITAMIISPLLFIVTAVVNIRLMLKKRQEI